MLCGLLLTDFSDQVIRLVVSTLNYETCITSIGFDSYFVNTCYRLSSTKLFLKKERLFELEHKIILTDNQVYTWTFSVFYQDCYKIISSNI